MCVKEEKYGTVWPGMAEGGLRQISSGQWKALCAKLGDLDTLINQGGAFEEYF